MSNHTNEWLWPPPEPVGLSVIGDKPEFHNAKYPVRRVFCVGRNYEAHAFEMNAAVDRQQPFYFTKSAHAIVAAGGKIPYAARTTNLHFEFELVIALGNAAFNVSTKQAPELVYGYACGIDFTRRDLQDQAKENRKPWDVSKDFDYGAVVSPIKRWPDRSLPTGQIELRVNNEYRQDAELDDMVWSVPEIISDLSTYYRLAAGDLIFTGTPAGVGAVNVGDKLVGTIAGIGRLEIEIGHAE